MSNTSGYGENIEGIPLPGSNEMPLVKGSAVPNRDEPLDAFNADGGADVISAGDYFDEEKANLGDANEPYVANKEDEQWSVGLEDEENDGVSSFVEQDNDLTSDGAFVETQPLHVQGSSKDQPIEEFDGIVLEPDNIQYGSD